MSESEAAVAGGFACWADATLYTLNVTEVEITAVMPVFHSLMQQFLAAESDSKRWLWRLILLPLKPYCTSILSCYLAGRASEELRGLRGR
ncbi:MAG: hypothetical protein KY448_05525 [Cyanobacteria bacterium 0813]|nr:hypothetical protein [Cyanobacteria bacterium 0813]